MRIRILFGFPISILLQYIYYIKKKRWKSLLQVGSEIVNPIIMPFLFLIKEDITKQVLDLI